MSDPEQVWAVMGDGATLTPVGAKGPHANLTSSGKACVATFQTQRPKGTREDGVK